MNKVILVGNLCKDVEVRVTSSGTSVVRNSIAVKNNFKNSEGEYDTERIELLGSKQKEDVTPYDFEPQEQEKNYDPFADFGSTVVIDDDFLD